LTASRRKPNLNARSQRFQGVSRNLQYDATILAIVCFGLSEDRPRACFAGIWTSWNSVRKAKEGEVTCDLYAFLTTEANAEVAPVHPKAMPVILTTEQEVDVWLNAPTPVALELQRPLANGKLRIVARGERTDGA
jgi:putative SOS response-associated peptidase YedK